MHGTPYHSLNFSLPQRLQVPGWTGLVCYALFLAFFAWSLARAGISPGDLISGLPNMAQIAGEMVPPATDRFWAMADATLTTLQMALVGTVVGILISIPLALLCASNVTRNPAIRHVTRSIVSFLRTVPDLAWALFFVASVGLGPFAGTLTLVVDTVGFCARFFAESIEEVDPGASEALAAFGAGPFDRIAVGLIPGALPGMINTSLFSLEKAVRASVVLGLVGAGGIGAELAVSMEMFRYDQAATIILMVFALVFTVEQFSSRLRSKLMQQGV